MTARQILQSCRDAVTEITSLEGQIEQVSPSGIPSGNLVARMSDIPYKTNDRTAAALDAVEGYVDMIRDRQIELVRLFVLLEDVIHHVSSGRDRAILRYYYGQGWTEARIAVALGVDERTIRRRKAQSVGLLDLVYRVNPLGKSKHKAVEIV